MQRLMLNVEARLDAARNHLAARAYEQAHRLCMSVIADDPNEPRAYFLLGHLAADHQNARKALPLFDLAIARGLDTAEVHAQRSRCLTALNRQAEAVSAADRAMERLNDGATVPAHAYDTLGVVYSRTGWHDRAIGLFEKAVAMNSTVASFHYNLGASQQFVGRFDDAERSYGRAAALDPLDYRSPAASVHLRRQSMTDNAIDRLEAMFPKGDDDPDRSLHLGHALAKTYEDLGDYPKALDWLERAKAPKSRRINYRFDRDGALFEAAARTVAEQTHNGVDSPIFVVGLPRTGTTLVDRILSSHPDVASVGELSQFALLIKRSTGTSSPYVLDAETLDATPGVDLSAVGEAYVASVSPLAKGAPRFVDKMPLNVFYAALINQALPGARIVCLRRNAMDACLSNYRQLFATGFSYYNYAYQLEDIARYYVAFDGLVAHWRATLPTDRFMEIAYEDLVSDQEERTRSLLAFCGLDWDPACLAFHTNAAPVATASSVQVRTPLYSTSVGRWRRYGDRLKPLADALGDLAKDDRSSQGGAHD